MNIIERLEDDELYVDAVDDAIAVIEDLVGLCKSAVSALRSYQYGNGSPALAEEIADHIEKVLRTYE